MTTLKEFKNGSKLGKEIYQEKPYIVLSKENVVLSAGSAEDMKALDSYFDNCEIEIREFDLYMNNNKKIGMEKIFSTDHYSVWEDCRSLSPRRFLVKYTSANRLVYSEMPKNSAIKYAKYLEMILPENQ